MVEERKVNFLISIITYILVIMIGTTLLYWTLIIFSGNYTLFTRSLNTGTTFKLISSTSSQYLLYQYALSSTNIYLYIASVLTYMIFFIFICNYDKVVIYKFTKPYKEITHKNFKNFKKWLLMIVIYFAAIFAVSYTMLGFKILAYGTSVLKENNTSINQQILNEGVISFPVLLFLMVVIFSPFAEEVVFRYAIIGFFNKNKFLGLNNKIWGLLISSIFFALIHITPAISYGMFVQNLWYLPQYFTMGFLFGITYLWTNESLFYSYGLHSLNNLVVIIFLFITLPIVVGAI